MALFYHRWVFHQEDDSRAFSTAFEGKLFNISVLGVPSGEAQNCTACPAGYRSISENTDCSICPNGTASSAGSEECKACDEGYFAAKVQFVLKGVSIKCVHRSCKNCNFFFTFD